MLASPSRRYRILDVLGAGGFGTVYRAEMITAAGLRREVALKVLNERAAADEEAAARLRDEARILSNLNYVGIVRVDDLILLQGRWTMVMELVHGVDLERLIALNGPLPPAVALETIASVARTLTAAEQARGPGGEPLGLIHRDIKPANILISTGGMTKLLDFGVARARLTEREAATQKAIVMGSLPYLAPERYGFEDSPAGDVYALGAVFFELLTGQPFGRTHLSEQRHREKLRAGLMAAWELLPADVREPLLRFCAELLAYAPEQRPSAREVAARAEQLRSTLQAPGLASWADRRVNEALAGRGAPTLDALCGQELDEAGEEPNLDLSIVMPAPEVPERLRRLTPPPLDEPPPPRPGPRPAVVLALSLLVGAALALLALSLWPAPPAPPSPAPAPEGTPFTLQDVAGLPYEAEPPVAAAPEAPDPAPAARRPAPEAPAAPPPEPAEDPLAVRDPWATRAPAARAPDPANPWGAAPEALGEGMVLVLGELDHAQLVDARGERRWAGPVPPGTYTVFPSFTGGYTVKGPTVTVLDGQTLVVRCDARDRTCDGGRVE